MGQEPSDGSGKTPDDYLTITGNFSGLKIGGNCTPERRKHLFTKDLKAGGSPGLSELGTMRMAKFPNFLFSRQSRQSRHIRANRATE
jgi:hypothetical protein